MNQPQPVVALGSDRMGNGPEELGHILMQSFLFTLTELPVPPSHLLFFGSGVQLCAEGSASLPSLQTLADKGCQLLVCGTCADFYHIRDQLRVGGISNMPSIVGVMAGAERLIQL